jgi:GNAT superfamily N-acetyltransferase
MHYEWSFETSRLDIPSIHAFLAGTYWSAGIPREVVERAVAHSLCLGGYHGERQVAFARMVTDRATFAYLADVFVVPEHRGKGLARQLMARLLAHPDVQGLRRMMLATRDAHGLYAAHGFTALAAPERFMERHAPDVYRSGAARPSAECGPAPPADGFEHSAPADLTTPDNPGGRCA